LDAQVARFASSGGLNAKPVNTRIISQPRLGTYKFYGYDATINNKSPRFMERRFPFVLVIVCRSEAGSAYKVADTAVVQEYS
jgi:hypothetical protein